MRSRLNKFEPVQSQGPVQRETPRPMIIYHQFIGNNNAFLTEFVLVNSPVK